MVHNYYRLCRMGVTNIAKNTTVQAAIFLLVLANKYFSVFLKNVKHMFVRGFFCEKNVRFERFGEDSSRAFFVMLRA